MKTLTVKVPEELLARLDTVSKRRSVGRSALVRKALQRFLEADAHNKAPTISELAGDLIGSVKGGPRDLSCNPRYMKGFGK